MKTTLLFLALLIISFSTKSYSQIRNRDLIGAIRNDIQKNIDLQFSREKLENLLAEAKQAKDVLAIGRIYAYLLLIDDKRTEDTLYFKSSAFIDSMLLSTTTNSLLKGVMHLMQAKRINHFLHQGKWQNKRKLFDRKDIPFNYALLNDEQLKATINANFQAAKSIFKSIHSVNIEDALWLSDDPLLFLFKPDLYDIAIAEEIKSLKQQEGWKERQQWSQSRLVNLSQISFLKVLDTLTTTPMVSAYREWIHYYLQKDKKNNAFFIETLLRKFIHSTQHQVDTANSWYEIYLGTLTSSPYTPVKAHGVYQLFQIWRIKASMYYEASSSYNNGYFGGPKYNYAYKDNYKKAIALFSQNNLLMDSFPYLKTAMIQAVESMKVRSLQLETEMHALPGKPILAKVSFKNISTVHLKIYRVPTHSVKLKKVDTTQLLASEATRAFTVALPLLQDYQPHSLYYKLDALPVGDYFILGSDSPLVSGNKQYSVSQVKVTSIAVMENGHKIFALNRETGQPISNLSAIIKYEKYNDSTKTYFVSKTENKKVDRNGILNVNEQALKDILFINGTDSFFIEYSKRELEVPDNVYDKSEYGYKMEYYEEETRIHIFTDRSIYRPGQTVHFKGIFTTRNPDNGELIILNWHNLKLPFMQRLILKTVAKFNGKKFQFYLNDPFNRQIDTLELFPNNYGSVSGSFTIPESATNGDWDIEFDDDDLYFEMDNNNDGSFKVEEYKRPTFEVNIDKPFKMLLPADSFSLKVKVKSFAGLQLNNTRIIYNVTRNVTVPFFDTLSQSIIQKTYNETILDDEAITNEKGFLILPVNDSLLKHVLTGKQEKINVYYDVDVEAIDATGESHEISTNFTISNRPVEITIKVDKLGDLANSPSITLQTSIKNIGAADKIISLKLYRLPSKQEKVLKNPFGITDTFLFSKEELSNYFPNIGFDTTNDSPAKVLVYESTEAIKGSKKIEIPPGMLSAGNYMIAAVCTENNQLIGESSANFSLYNSKQNQFPGNNFFHCKLNSGQPGDSISCVNGSADNDLYVIYHMNYYRKKGQKVMMHDKYITQHETEGINKFHFVIPKDIDGNLMLVRWHIKNNHLYSDEQTIFTYKKPKEEPAIIIEQFRSIITPGAEETFSLSVKTKDEKVAAEMLTTMYDASLDKIEPHKWHVPGDYHNRYLQSRWDDEINHKNAGSNFQYQPFLRATNSLKELPLWWLTTKPETLKYVEYEMHDYVLPNMLSGRVAGLDINSSSQLNEVVVVGYGISKKRDFTGSVITIRGSTGLSGYKTNLVILDGVVYTGELSAINASTITNAMVLQGAEAAAIYGSRAADGVLLLSTKNEILLPSPPEPPVQVRSNFQETAFFYPKITADKNGYYKFSFKMPESVTEWKWKMLAHTKKAAFIYKEKTLVSQLPLMVQPNMPRILYQGDKLLLQTRISNLDTIAIKGKITCRIEDVITGEDITASMLTKKENEFSIGVLSNSNSSFNIVIPPSLLHPIKIIITAVSGNFSDGEEHILPILSKKVFITTTKPFLLVNTKDFIIPSIPVLPGMDPYGISMYISPKLQASLVRSLAYLSNFSFDCAEQTFNKLLANVTAIKLMRTDTALQAARLSLKNISSKTTTSVLPGELTEQSMPWLNLGNKTLLQQQQLSVLLDTMNCRQKIKDYLNHLYELQHRDGGMRWFRGGESNSYISQYIMGAFGKLQADFTLTKDKYETEKHTTFLEKLVAFCDIQAISKTVETLSANYLYNRSFFASPFKIADTLQPKIDSAIQTFWNHPGQTSLTEQAQIIIACFNLYKPGDSAYIKATRRLASIQQLAIKDEQTGIRWKEISAEETSSNTTEETVALLIEAFSKAGIPAMQSGIIKWLLISRNEQSYQSTKATAALVNALLKEQNNQVAAPTQSLSTTIKGNKITVSNSLLSGQLYQYENTPGNFPKDLTVSKLNSNISANGSLNYYYFASTPTTDLPGSEISISKKLFWFNMASNKWIPLTDTTKLTIGDKVKTILSLESRKMLQYVYINDSRSGCLEPLDGESGYRYATNFSYYKSDKDEGYQIFAEKIPSGSSEISYETVVSQSGIFNNGIASLQCMYQPAIKAYSNSITLTVK
ncbi:MAG: MG2 domain-containing protein [Bacteroidota bacterium]